jgi:enamine deaminase RidA (YjgF/YER057c/UK114 family)
VGAGQRLLYTSKSHILQATIWLADMADFAEMNAIYDAWIDPTNPRLQRSRTCNTGLQS